MFKDVKKDVVVRMSDDGGKRRYLHKVKDNKRKVPYRFKRRVFNKEGNEEVGKEVPEEDEGMEGDKEERLDEENEYGDVQ